jgi:dTDP-glucose 4,6-dehydratase
MANRCIAITGCCGFLGHYVTEKLLARGDLVYGVDALTYAADPTLPPKWISQYGERFKFVNRDINDLGTLPDVDAIINLAAETHVDLSLTDSARFVHTNVLGVQHLLEMVRAKSQYGMPVFIQASTDETYGEILDGAADENAPLNPSSPYAASKAAADCLILGWGRTFKVPYRIVRPANLFGLGQFPEKLIPKAVRRLMLGQAIPLHGDGKAERNWLWVEDCATAILTVLDRGTNGEVYNVPGPTTASILDVALWITQAFGGGEYQCGFERPGLDRKYSMVDGKLGALGWKAIGEIRRDLPDLVTRERESLRW